MIGMTITHYKKLEKHGEGGMGVVYKAEDTKLHRTVALKFLPPELTRDEDAKQRFIQEARAASSLDHNNICVVHGIDETENGQLFICMNYYEGETLKHKIEKGPLKLDETVGIAIQIAQGLLKAHEQRIIHRDIKPANIFITNDGVVKILDFGLAKLSGPALTTKLGSTLGTIAYMSPEQTRGEEVNHRTDIWSLGVVLYEMIIGKPPFRGEYEQAILYSIISEEPVPITELRTGIPLELERIVTKALVKKQDERYQHIDDMLVDMQVLKSRLSQMTASSPFVRPHQTTLPARRVVRWGLLIPWFVALLSILVAVVAFWKPRFQQTIINQPPVRFSVSLQEGDSLKGISGSLTAVAISRDGRKLVFGVTQNGVSRLYIRTLESLQTRPISGTEGAYSPSFSPDGEWIVFFAGGYLKKVYLLGGAPQNIFKASGNGATWCPDNTIVFQRWGAFGGLFRIQSDGSQLQQISTGEMNNSHSLPEFLPGARAVLFTSVGGGEESRIAVMSLESGKIQYLLKGGEYARYASTGHILYNRPREGEVWAAPFNVDELKLTGSPFPVLEGVRHFALSTKGTLAFIPGSGVVPNNTIVLVTREGEIKPLLIPPGAFHGLRFSPDGKSLVFSWHQTRVNIWIYDLERNVLRRFTEEQGNDWTPFWMPDGKRILFQSIRTGPGYRVLIKSLDAGGPSDSIMVKNQILQPGCWTADGKTLIAQLGIFPETLHDIILLQLDGDRTPKPIIQTQYSERFPALSPDGRWLAYASDESDRWEVYIRRYPDLTDVKRISMDGGLAPMWNPDGRGLYYWDTSRNSLVFMPVRSGSMLEIGIPKLCAAGDFTFGSNAWYRSFDISPDGKNIAIIRRGKSGQSQKQLTVVLNWFEELKARERGGH
jgi:serine/threonine protein kinase